METMNHNSNHIHEHDHHHGHDHHHHHGHDHGHDHCNDNCHEHDNDHSDGCGCCHHHEGHKSPLSVWLPPAVSFFLLIAGILFNYFGLEWFRLPYVEFFWFLAAFIPVGLPVIKEAVEAIREKDFFNELTLMVIASLGAFCIKEYPEGVAVMLFYTIGETLQHGAVDRATRNITRLLDVRPEITSLLKDGKFVEVSPKTVAPGETILVKPGERVPLDGSLLSAEGVFDTSALTGESVPRDMESGSEVLAGMIAVGNPVQIRVTKSYDKSALARILEMVRDASSKKAPTEKFIRRFARIYTPLVFALAVLVVAVPALFVHPYVFSEWLYRALVFLVISCPCALVISVPLGYFAGIGAASRLGILFKGGNYLDAITHIDTVAFDKTGTLTTGTFEVTSTLISSLPESEFLSYVAAVERNSTHPIAKAVVRYANKMEAPDLEASNVSELSGHGMSASVGAHSVLVGNIKLMESHGVEFPEELNSINSTLVVCAIDGVYAGLLSLADTLKPDAEATVSLLRKLGIENIQLLSGDRRETVAEVARKIGISREIGGMLPEDKARHIESLVNEGHKVAFVGDGMNDAPVLALSTVGVAMGGLGSGAAVESADIVIQDDMPSKLPVAVRIGRFTYRIVRENIAGAISVKLIILIAGVLGYASLWGAVFADVGVSLLAVMNSLRIMHKKYL